MNKILARGGVEFVAVLLGITLSLYLDEQSDLNSKKLNERNLLSDLQVSLKQDLSYAEDIQKGLTNCVDSHSVLLSIRCNETKKYSRNEVAELLYNSSRGVKSFFPRYGVYRALSQNNDLGLIDNDTLKSRLITLYDFIYLSISR